LLHAMLAAAEQQLPLEQRAIQFANRENPFFGQGRDPTFSRRVPSRQW